MISALKYPNTRKVHAVDVYHDVKILDSYRWLENPDSEETKQFIAKQNDISRQFLENNSEWKKINEKLTKLWNFPKYKCPVKYGKYYYTFVNTGLQNQSVLYQQSSLNAKPTVFLDPNKLSDDGTISLAQTSFSEDGLYMAYGLSESGSDWRKIRIRNVKSGKDCDEVLEKIKFSEISWTKDNKGFFYECYPDHKGKIDGSETIQNENQKLFYHHVGNPQKTDILIADFPENPSWCIEPIVSDCGNYLIMQIVKDCHNNILYYANLEKSKPIEGELKILKVVDKFESDYEYVTNIASKIYLRTNNNAPNYRIIEIDLENPAEELWKTLIPEHKKDVLDWVLCVDENKLLLGYIRDVKSVLQANCLLTGKVIRKFDLDIGSIVAVSGKKTNSEIFYYVESFLCPGTTYRYDFKTPNVNPKIFRETQLNLDDFDKNDYIVVQVFFLSKGTKIPMFIIRKNTERIKPRPCLLYGYGGFNISLQPSFSVTGLMFIDTFDGVLAYPNIRGGGEYGKKWHNSGRLLNKQNVFDDFQSSAEYLIHHNYTSKDRLVIEGGSNGGLLVAACINQRPDLFGAAVAHVGVLDMLRFPKFTIGHFWRSEYGDPEEKEHFENLLKYSPLHNTKTPMCAFEEYPSTLILTADHDDRVSPLHSFKFIATLQEAVRQSEFQKNPLLLRVYNKTGHGAGKPTTKRIEESTDVLTFISKCLNTDDLNI